jgi:hypothetical protein
MGEIPPRRGEERAMANVSIDKCDNCRENIFSAIGKVREYASAKVGEKVGKWAFGIIVSIAVTAIAASFIYTTAVTASRAEESRENRRKAHANEMQVNTIVSDVTHMQKQIDQNHKAVMDQLRELKADIKALKK